MDSALSSGKQQMECRDGYCTYWRECRHCGDFIKRPESMEQRGLYTQVVCDACWQAAIGWRLQGWSIHKIGAELGVNLRAVQYYLARRHLAPEQAYRRSSRITSLRWQTTDYGKESHRVGSKNYRRRVKEFANNVR